MGKNGSLIAKDAFGFTLHYFDENTKHDYMPVGATTGLTSVNPSGFNFASLYNGNIGAMSVNVPQVGSPMLYNYRYDQLNRLKSMNAFTGLNSGTNSWEPISTDAYRENINYDPNGNILSYNRHGDAARIPMDSLLYSYKPNTNQLDKVVERAADASSAEYDKYNDIKQGQANANYKYDAIGNLISDASEGITDIQWNVYGKIKSITKAGSNIKYTYDASGNRISKTANGKATYYVRDASGNVMSIYEQEDTLKQTELHIFGSSRLGIYNVDQVMQNCPTISPEIGTFARGNKFFELSNHLGNVLATISDKKIGFSSDGTTIDYYKAEVVSAQDYYPFGMQMPGRKYSLANTEYRYGFNGKELDKEVYGEGNAYDFGARIYDPRLGRWFAIDQLAEVQPNKTPYHFVSNNPISRVDPTGMLDHEFDKDGNKISDLGGDKIDFHHQANGDTKITDKASGASNIIAGGEALIRGYTQRDNNTSWGTLFNEWDQGKGAEKSMFADFDNTSTGVFGSFDNAFSTYGGKARSAVLSEGKSKGPVRFDYGDINPLTAGFDGWEQFIGRASLSYYKLGDKVLYMMNDSKSMTSFMYRMSPSWDRSDFRLNGNTHQTYIWTETMGEVQQKTQTRLNWNQRIQQSRQEYKNTESQRLPAIKW